MLAEKALTDAFVSFGGGEKPKYDALRDSINGFYRDMLRPLDELETAVYQALPTLPQPKALEPFRYTSLSRELIDQALTLFLTEMAGPDRSREGFVEGGLESDTPDGVIQQREVFSYAIGLERGAELLHRGRTLAAGRNSPSVLAMLDNAFSRLSTKGQFTLEPIRDDVHSILTSAQAAGLGPLDTARQLRKLFDDQRGYNFQRLARTEGAAAAIEGSRNQMAEFGVQYVRWLLAVGACPICQSFEGRLFRIDDTANHPPYASHPNCVVGGQQVWGPKASASTARWYTGEIVKIETVNGHRLTITPNHPVLTPKGWVAAGLLNKGSQIVCNVHTERMDAAVDPYEYQIPALVEDIARSVSEPGAMPARRVKTTDIDFHGDGGGSEVCIVRANRLLWHTLDAAFREPLADKNLGGRDPESLLLSRSRSETALLQSALAAAYGRMCGFDDLHPFFRGAAGREQTLVVAPTPFRDAVRMEPLAHRQPTNAEQSGDIDLGLARAVMQDEVRIIGRVPFSGHVYNLQTVPHWYTCNSIIVSNCVCDLTPA